MADQQAEAIVVGAGIAGLSCASALRARGAEVLVLDRRGVGGRAVTWRLDGGGCADYGVTFFHGERPDFLAALAAVDATPLRGWPRRVVGRGAPCQPHAFAPRSERLAFAEGVAAFPRHLARGLAVRRQTSVVNVAFVDEQIRLTAESGETFRAPTVVLALAGAQALRLLEGGPAHDELNAAAHLLRLAGAEPCLSLIAAYERTEELAWDTLLPEESRALLLVSNESSKRPSRGPVLVVQARAGWSRERLAAPPAAWSEELLGEAAGLVGDWLRRPSFVRPHAWRFARTDRGSELAGPLLVPLGARGARLGLAGELFGPGAGVEAAWLSGQALAARLATKEV